jgi:SAM-dependent methyltransferase
LAAYGLALRQLAPYGEIVNENHAQLCTSPEWATYLEDNVLPLLAVHADFGDEMLEIGPGPGAATGWLSKRVQRLVAVEVDADAARVLDERYEGSNVEVLVGDATELEFDDGSFDAVGSFTMLHHVPTTELQNRILAEALRVLRPGGVLVGSDSLPSNALHEFHAGDTYNPTEPSALLVRLQTLGYGQVTLVVDQILRFIACKPVGIDVEGGEQGADRPDARSDRHQTEGVEP